MQSRFVIFESKRNFLRDSFSKSEVKRAKGKFLSLWWSRSIKTCQNKLFKWIIFLLVENSGFTENMRLYFTTLLGQCTFNCICLCWSLRYGDDKYLSEGSSSSKCGVERKVAKAKIYIKRQFVLVGHKHEKMLKPSTMCGAIQLLVLRKLIAPAYS